jgi:hypothetical protein
MDRGCNPAVTRATSTDDERKALQKAQATLSTLAPGAARTDAIAFALQYAARVTTSASAQGFSSDAPLNNMRGEAAIALNGMAGSLGGPNLTQDLIDRAKQAVADLLVAMK